MLVQDNHDVIRGRTSNEIAKEVEAKRAGLVKQGDIDTSPFSSSCPLEYYYGLQQAVCSYQHNSFFTSVDTSDHLNVVSVNSAWLCQGREAGLHDKGHLCIDESSLDAAVKNLSPSKTSILMMHHPVSWLTHNSQMYLEDVIQKNFHVVLYGHEHDPNAKNLHNEGGEAVYLQSSAAKANWSYGLNGYSVIKIDSKTGAVQVRYRSYSPRRKVYIDGNDVVESGYFYPRASDKRFWMTELSVNPNHLIGRAEVAAKITDYKEVFERNFPSRAKLDYDPIDPMFRSVEFTDGERFPTPRQEIGRCLDRVDEFAYFVGPRDSGLTTSCYMAYQYICKNISDFQSIPVYVNLEEITLNRANLIREVQRGAIASYTQKESEILCESGSVFFVFDSVCLQQSDSLDKLTGLLNQFFPKCRFVIFCSTNARGGGASKNQAINLDPSEDLIF